MEDRSKSLTQKRSQVRVLFRPQNETHPEPLSVTVYQRFAMLRFEHRSKLAELGDEINFQRHSTAGASRFPFSHYFTVPGHHLQKPAAFVLIWDALGLFLKYCECFFQERVGTYVFYLF